MSELLQELKHWRVEGTATLINYYSYDYWVNWDDLEEIVTKYEKQPNLNENQQIVLDYLKTQFGKHEIFVKSIFDPISDLLFDYWDGEKVDTAFEQLNLKQEIQVLQAFSAWSLEQEEE